MTNYGASIQLADKMTPILNNIISALNMTVSTVYDMQSSVDGFDASGFDTIRETIAQTESAWDSLNEKIKEPLAPAQPESAPTSQPETPTITWSSGNFDVFTNTGVDRFVSESQAALDVMNLLTEKQQEIASKAANVDIFPENAVTDMNNIGTRMAVIQSRIQQIESNPANPLDPNASNELERLRQQLSQALTYQEQMNAAVNDLDVSRANQLYQQLNNIVNQTEREIRDNVNAQGQFNNSINQGVNSANILSSTFSNVASALGLYKIGSELMQTASQAVNFASDLQEVQNIVDVTFGSAATTVDEWSAKTLDAYGINELSAKQYAGTMGAMLKSSGVAADSVADMSMSIAELSGDMASFYNLSGDEAFNKIRSGISGETEPLKQLGINMSVANLEAYALSQGISETYSEMTQGEQTILRYNYLLSTTADAQGDFARTSDSYANQTRLLDENWTSFTATLASDALPILTTITQTLNSAISFLTEHSDTVSAVLVGLATGVTVAAVAWGVYTAVQWLAVAANRALVVSLLTNPFVWIAIVIAVVVAAIYKWVQSLGGLQNAWNIVKLALQIGIYSLRYAFFYCIDAIMTKIESMQLAWQTAGVMIADCIGRLKVNALTILQDMINGAIGYINKFINILNTLPGVSIDAVTEFTFATTAATEYEAEMKAKTDELYAYQAELENKQAERAANLAQYKSEWENATVEFKSTYSTYVEAAAENSGVDSLTEEYIADMASNTSDIKDTISASSDSELEWLRKIAERETVNKFTTAEIKLDFQSNATINSDIDIDGFINTFTEELSEVLVTTAEGLED